MSLILKIAAGVVRGAVVIAADDANGPSVRSAIRFRTQRERDSATVR
jgi:hypothetical protein